MPCVCCGEKSRLRYIQSHHLCEWCMVEFRVRGTNVVQYADDNRMRRITARVKRERRRRSIANKTELEAQVALPKALKKYTKLLRSSDTLEQLERPLAMTQRPQKYKRRKSAME